MTAAVRSIQLQIIALSVLMLKIIMTRHLPILFLLPIFLVVVACDRNHIVVGDLGLAGTWEVDLSPNSNVSAFKGQVNFNGSRYQYIWYQLMEDADIQSRKWMPIEMEQGNIVIEKPGIMELLADSYGTPSHIGDSQSQDEIDYILKPSKSDYLIHYEIQNDKLVWMEDRNLDGDFDDVNEFPETMIYMRVKS